MLADADNGGSSIIIESEFDTSLVVGGAIGYAFDGRFRGEIALDYRQHDVDTLTITIDGGLGVALGVGSLNGLGASAFGEASAFSGMVNDPHWQSDSQLK